jgi:hypothetical protein
VTSTHGKIRVAGAMHNPNEIQHSVSRVLLARFKIPGNPLQCYQVRTGRWIPKSPERACAWSGYSQLLIPGQPSDKIERTFSAVESRLPTTFKQLEEAAKKPFTEFLPDIYENMCRYCACLKNIGLFAKPDALVGFAIQVNMELEKGEYCLLCDFNIPEKRLGDWRKEYAQGNRIIIESENAMQLLYTFQFERWYERDYGMFRGINWAICTSPIELPISDVGLVPIVFPTQKAVAYILPIGLNLVLKGIQNFDPARNSPQEGVSGIALDRGQAEYVFDIICSSAVTEIVCSRQNPDVAASISRAKENGASFPEIVDPLAITSAGLINASDELRFRVVPLDEYQKFIRSHVKPRTLT